jgi:pimeloyl-ACP methyl ester carboxylesterase
MKVYNIYKDIKFLEMDTKFFTFENSAHGTILEEPEKFVQIIREIALKNRNE